MEMDNDDILVGRIYSRREILGLFGVAGIALMTGCGGANSILGGGVINLLATPALTEGPFFVDEKLNRSNVTTNTTRVSVINGLPLILNLNIHRIVAGVGVPISGAMVDIWHTDAIGKYSDIASEGTFGQTYLRGFQNTDASGAVQFTTIYPGWYSGRAVHIHFKVRIFNANGTQAQELTSQFFFSDTLSNTVFTGTAYTGRGTRNTLNSNDGIFNTRGTDGNPVGSQLTLGLTPVTAGSGYTANFNIGLQF